MQLIAALPMYDWPECREETDRQWERIRRHFLDAGIAAPATLVRCNAEMPPIPGGIRDESGRLLAPDPASLPADGLDLATLWRHPALLFAQSCWGPLECGLSRHVVVSGTPDYSIYSGGEGASYRSALIMRRSLLREDCPVPGSGTADLSVVHPGLRFAYNDSESLSGYLALRRDLAAAGLIANESGFESFWSECFATGSHRHSACAVASGNADLAAIDCRALELFRRYEPDAAARLSIAGWTNLRPAPPFIMAAKLAAKLGVNSATHPLPCGIE